MNLRILLIGLVLLAIAPITLTAQSGRRTPAKTTPTPVAPVSQPTLNKSGSESGAALDSSETISSIMVAGELVSDAKHYWSSYLDRALDECIKKLRDLHRLADVAKGGKLIYNEAKELAKTKSDTYVLWISFIEKTDSLGNSYIEYAEYAVLMPKSGRRMTNGRVKPDERSVISTGGVLGLPNPRTNRSLPTASLNQMKKIAWQIPDILEHGGWLGH